jgi:uncharacterized membrane protein YczE
MGPVGIVAPGVPPNLSSLRRGDHHTWERDQPGIVHVGKTERSDRPGPVRVGEDGKWQCQLLHHRGVLLRRVDTQAKDPGPCLEKLVVSSCDCGQLAVAVASEIASMESDHGCGVVILGERPRLAGCIRHGEIDHWDPFAWSLLPIVSVLTVMFIPIGGGRLPRRLVQLTVGLSLFGVGIGLMLQSGLGVPPWDVLHQGLAMRLGLTVGFWSIVISFVVLLLWLPLKEPYGVGTLMNAVIIGVVIDLTTVAVPEAGSSWIAWAMLGFGILIIGWASGMYIGASLGPGPRDGLMTGIAKRGPSIRLTRSVIEVTVLAFGWLMDGTFGPGTVAFALFIGPLVQFFLPRWAIVPQTVEDLWHHPAR